MVECQALAYALRDFRGVGAFEAMPMTMVRQLIETNTIGVMAMCQTRRRENAVRNLEALDFDYHVDFERVR